MNETIVVQKRYVGSLGIGKSNGRKHSVGTALFTEQGETIGYAQSVWIELNGAEA